MTDNLEFVLLPGGNTRTNCPTSTVIDTDADFSGNIWLKDEENDNIYPGYAYRKDEKHLEIFVVIPHATRKTEIELVLSKDQPEVDEEIYVMQPMNLKQKDDNTIEIWKNGKIFTRFRFPTEESFTEESGIRPYFMPLNGPYDEPVTREYPLKEKKNGSTDHIHHRSLWAAWGDVNGADNWSEGITGVPQFVKKVSIKEAGCALAHIQAKIHWMDQDGEDPILEETRDVFIFNSIGTETLIDWRIHFSAPYEDIKFGDTKEAGFVSVRVADSMRGSHGGLIENSFGGQMEPECWGKKAPWCDYSGNVRGHKCGITLMDHPENLGYPSRWHVRDYGLMAANPIGLKDFTGDKSAEGYHIMKKDEEMDLKYRVYVHAGNAQQGNVSSKYLDFVNPPELKYLDFPMF